MHNLIKYQKINNGIFIKYVHLLKSEKNIIKF